MLWVLLDGVGPDHGRVDLVDPMKAPKHRKPIPCWYISHPEWKQAEIALTDEARVEWLRGYRSRTATRCWIVFDDPLEAVKDE